MKRLAGIIALLAITFSVAPRDAAAYVYGYDPAKAVGNGGDWYMELAQDPTQITSGIYNGKYEYFFDLYVVSETFYWTDLVGLDNSKIANAQTTTPDGDAYKTQEWGDPNGYANRAGWADATGRIVDLWSIDRNADQTSAETTDQWRATYDDGGGGWTDAGLGWYAGSSTGNPHSYAEYVDYSSAGPTIWKAELTGPGQGLHWWYTQFGVNPAQDTIMVAGSTAWASPFSGGLAYSLRIVYDEPIVQGNIGWSPGSATAQYPVLGDFTVAAPNLCIIGDGDCDGYVDIAGDILPAFTAFSGPGSTNRTRLQGDVQGDGTGATTDPAGHDGDVDVSDLLVMFGAFTGPAPDGSGGLVAADAGDANVPDLIYNAATGEVTLDVDGSGIIGYVLKNGDNSFDFLNHTQILAGLSTSLGNELSEAAFATSVGANSIGNVFPLGMDLAALTAYLTVNDVSRSLGASVVPFDLVVLTTGPVVPEPATVLLSVFGLMGMGVLAYRRR